MTGTQLATLAEEINGGASIGSTLLEQLLNMAKALIEQRRPATRHGSPALGVFLGRDQTGTEEVCLTFKLLSELVRGDLVVRV